MNADERVAIELAALRALPMPALAARHAELIGRPPRSLHRASVEHAVAFELQRRALGDLSDAARARLEELVAEAAPRLAPTNATAPARAVAVPSRPEHARPADRLPAPGADVCTRPPPRRLAPCGLPIGTVLARDWRGARHTATVRDYGIEVEDGAAGTTRKYASLSAAASAITGVKWNGKVWWGVGRAKEPPT